MRFRRLSITCLLLIVACTGFAQEFKIHSHNDYRQNVPFWKAFGAEVQSIEVDVFYLDEKLMVAHEVSEVKQYKTLERLYLNPLNNNLPMSLILFHHKIFHQSLVNSILHKY